MEVAFPVSGLGHPSPSVFSTLRTPSLQALFLSRPFLSHQPFCAQPCHGPGSSCQKPPGLALGLASSLRVPEAMGNEWQTDGEDMEALITNTMTGTCWVALL